MTTRVAVNHRTLYRFDRAVGLSPHEIRLRPAAHARTPVHSYSLKVKPDKHFVNWQQDAYGNYVARLVFPEKARELSVTVDLVVDMTVIDPFDFFVESCAERFPFEYPAPLAKELAPFLECEPAGPLLARWIEEFRAEPVAAERTVDFLVRLNQRVQRDVAYLVRMAPGVQSCEETLRLKSGSCRDSGWLLVQILREFGLAARFVSGYLVQLMPDIKPLDGPAGPARDFTDLHAWAEVYLPGAGWIGLDPTSGLLAGEGHIPLACTAAPGSAAPVVGSTDGCEAQLEFSMTVDRLHETARVTKPYTEEQWRSIDRLGRQVDAELAARNVRLTQGGEPTFVSIDDTQGPEWNFTALSQPKLKLAQELARRLKDRFAPGALQYFGQGKWYPGEALPRWILGIYWRADGKPLWRGSAPGPEAAPDFECRPEHARKLIAALAENLGLHPDYVIPAYEDVWQALQEEARLPLNVDPLECNLADADERGRLARMLSRGLGEVAGYVLPLRPAAQEPRKSASKSDAAEPAAWLSSRWPLKREHLFLLPGDSPLGLRLPLTALPWVEPAKIEREQLRDPFEAREELGDTRVHTGARRVLKRPDPDPQPKEVIHTALCVEPRAGALHVFLPPMSMLEDYVALAAAVDNTAAGLKMPVLIEGYPPPSDPRLRVLNITPDPGVIEVNIHPASSWDELVANCTGLYEEARLARLSAEKFMLDGRHTGTGGGNHITLGAMTPADSPWLRRPDLLKSVITYWQNHPSLSYLFSGAFVGPTSQAPRVDEARDDNLYDLEIAFQQMEKQLPLGQESAKPWLVDRLLRNLLVDMTGNTHRAEFCIDKLYSPVGPAGRLGLVEFRAFEMPPHARMSLTQSLLLRALVARFWGKPYQGRLVPWGTQLHDRFMLPHFVIQDMHDVLRDLQADGYAFQPEWFAPFFEFRFPRFGAVVYESVQLELRQAIEPWHVLGEEMQSGGMARYVDSSVERLQVKVNGMINHRHVVACNGRQLPLHPTGVQGEFVAGVRYRAWNPPSAQHPTIGVHTPLVFDIVDTWSGRAIGGCTYHVDHPGGRNSGTFPVNANEAEARRVARFWNHGHTPGLVATFPEPPNRNFPFTLDLRRHP